MPELPLLTSIHYAGNAAQSVYWMTAEDIVIVLDKDTAEISFSSLPNDLPNVSDKATRIWVFSGKDGPVHIAVLTKHFLKVFMQAEDNSQWVMKTRISLSWAMRQLFGEKPQAQITMDKLKEIVWVAERSAVLGTEKACVQGEQVPWRSVRVPVALASDNPSLLTLVDGLYVSGSYSRALPLHYR